MEVACSPTASVFSLGAPASSHCPKTCIWAIAELASLKWKMDGWIENWFLLKRLVATVPLKCPLLVVLFVHDLA